MNSNVVKKGKNDSDRTSGDCISRQQAIDTAIDAVDNWDGGCNKHREQIIRGALEILPSIQAERPTGEWIQKPRYEDDEYPDAQPNLKCPFCGYEIGWCDMGNYCAKCGADLKGGAV